MDLSAHTPHKQLLINGLPQDLFAHQDRQVVTANLMLDWMLSLFPNSPTSGAPAEIQPHLCTESSTLKECQIFLTFIPN